MVDRTGILHSSPLILTLASVRFTPWPVFQKEIDRVQEALRDLTPHINKIHIQTAPLGMSPPQPGGDEPPTAWLLTTADKRCGINFSADQILFVSTTYSRYREFEQILKRGLEALFTQMKFAHVTSLGVRYVDHVRPKKGERPDQYITDRLLPSQLAGLPVLGGVVGFTYRAAEETELRVRSVCHPQALAIPDDLIPMAAMFSNIAPGQHKFRLGPLEEREILLDFDAVKSPKTPKRMDSSAELLTELSTLHSIANNFFRNEQVCTDFAFKAWREGVR